MASEDRAARTTAFLEKSSVGLSLWVGGVGLATMKGFVYLATGSVLVRASMFDSLGDVFSSAIMALTQWKQSDTSDLHRYPVGKGRFSALGVFFFCAFMFSTMSSMALDSLQALFGGGDEEAQVFPAVVPTRNPTEAAMRRLFQEKGRLHWVYSHHEIEAMIYEYSGHLGHVEPQAVSVDDDDDESGIVNLSTVLLAICVLVKVLLYMWCRAAERRTGSDIVSALATDHFNDTISNTMVIFTMVLLDLAKGSPWEGDWLVKVDPLVSLLLSLWIIKGWISNATEQFALLADQRSDEVDVEAINEAARTSLHGSPLQFQGTDVYNIGDGVRARLELNPAPGAVGCERVAGCMLALDDAVREACGDVRQVDMYLRPRSEGSKSESFAWVKEYSSK